MLRPVFGLGPDMLIYSYPFVGKPQTKLASVDHAHNYPLHILAEQGYAGFLLLVGASLLLVVAAFSTVQFLKKRSSDIQNCCCWCWFYYLPPQENFPNRKRVSAEFPI